MSLEGTLINLIGFLHLTGCEEVRASWPSSDSIKLLERGAGEKKRKGGGSKESAAEEDEGGR